MEKLTKRSDNFVETPSGQFAIVPRGASGRTAEKAWFEFKTSPASSIVRVEWDANADLVVVDADVASAMLRANYAKAPTDEQISEYNKLVDEWNKKNPPAKKQDGDDNTKKQNEGKAKDNAPKPDTLTPPPGAKV